jgi:hypothetical protein
MLFWTLRPLKSQCKILLQLFYALGHILHIKWSILKPIIALSLNWDTIAQ